MPQPAQSSSRRRTALTAVAALSATLLAACASVSLDEPLAGTPWRLAQIGGTNVARLEGDSGAEPMLQFDDAALRVTGNTGCNSFNAGYQRDGSRLLVGPVATTRRACAEPERSGVEQRFLAALKATDQFDLHGAQLTLLDNRLLPLAVFELGVRKKP